MHTIRAFPFGRQQRVADNFLLTSSGVPFRNAYQDVKKCLGAFAVPTSTTLADLEGGGDSQISFSVTHGWSAFGGADHGWQDAELGRGAWTLSDAVSGSVGPQGAATNVSSLRVGAGPSWRSQEHSADGGPARGW